MTRGFVSLDRLAALLSIGAGALAFGCGGRLKPLVPEALAPLDRGRAQAWTARTAPTHDTAIRFRFQYQDDRHRWGGHGTARIAPPDSLRFDYVGPLGLGSGAAVVVGDSAVWADPEQNFRSLIPAVRMLWAALGVVRPPAPDAAVTGSETPSRTLWRFAEGPDTLEYVAAQGSPRTLDAEWRHVGKIVARSRTDLDARGEPSTSRMLFPERSARLEFTVLGIDTAAVFPPTLWRSRR